MSNIGHTHIKNNLIVVGHVGSGKSTTIGHLLLKCQGISQEVFDNILIGKVEPGFFVGKIDTARHYVSAIDVPGHPDNISNLIAGISQADVALLIVSAEEEEFKAGMSEDGQIKEQVMLCAMFGVKQLIVCVNKMDITKPAWSKDRFDEISKEVKDCIKTWGYNPEAVPIVPVSGLQDENLLKRSKNVVSWYEGFTVKIKDSYKDDTGYTLHAALDTIVEPRRELNKPLRLTLFNVLEKNNEGVMCVMGDGVIHTGTLKPGDEIHIAQGNLTSTCQQVHWFHKIQERAFPGCVIRLVCKDIKLSDLNKGTVVGLSNNDPPKQCDSFEAKVNIIDHPGVIKNGYTPVVYCHTSEVVCRFDTILQKFDGRGRVLEELPKELRKGDTALVKMVPTTPMVVETNVDCKSLGRIAIRDSGKTIAIGTVMKVTKKSD